MRGDTLPHTRTLRIIAQDPTVHHRGSILTADVTIPAEKLGRGPWGHRVQVIDYDATTRDLYKPLRFNAYQTRAGDLLDPYQNAPDRMLLKDPNFHAQNVYAIVMRTLARFEFALGRRVSWSFDTHQLKVAPHAFADANAFYSTDDEALMFGYFAGRQGNVLTCLSHDIVAHETTHALLDGLRERYVDPSSPDQAAFHEGFSDVVALLSVFSLDEVVRAALSGSEKKRASKDGGRPTYRTRDLTTKALRESALLGLAEQMGQELSGVRGSALRQSAKLKPSPKYYYEDPDYLEPHMRGEILVVAVLNAFLRVWRARLGV